MSKLVPALAASSIFCFLLAAPGDGAPARHLVTHDFERYAAPPPPATGIQIATWDFEPCSAQGWTAIDNRILNDGSNRWTVRPDYSGLGGIVNNAAILSQHSLCWCGVDGYGNEWDYSIVLKYSGSSATISFDYLTDTEAGSDFMLIEADPLGQSESLVDYITFPDREPVYYRTELLRVDGLNLAGSVVALALPNFGPGTHEVYIRFDSDASGSAEDCLCSQDVLFAALVVDNIVVTDGTAYTENFEGPLNPNVSLVNSAPSAPFGGWTRLYPGITDNDQCTDNLTCAWLSTDNLTPTGSCDLSRFGFPDGLAVRNWLDDMLVSPWVSLVSTPSAVRTLLEFRLFPGNNFEDSRIVLNASVRGKYRVDNTDTPANGDSFDCVSPWEGATDWNSLGAWAWTTHVQDLSGLFPPDAHEIQVRFRVADWQRLMDVPGGTGCGPGPFLDDVNLFREVATGPRIDPGIDCRTQAQDAFPAVQNAITPGEHFSPTADIFGTIPFSCSMDIGGTSSPNVISGDSITVHVVDIRNTGGVTVSLYGAIVKGPHVGKAPAPYFVQTDFFQVPAENSRDCNGNPIPDVFFVDLDDTYFRGGDTMLYVWLAEDAGGGITSFPPGLTAAPVTVATAEGATGGLLEVSFLPSIDWDPVYLARIAGHASGDLDPTPTEISNSSQSSAILYVQKQHPCRRSSILNRTCFMVGLDQNATSTGRYDVYDLMGYGNTNNDIGSRATSSQLGAYQLVVHDAGRRRSSTVPDGTELDSEKIAQQQQYLDYLDNGSTSVGGSAALWLIGENVAEEIDGTPLLARAGAQLGARDVGILNPNVDGITVFGFPNTGIQDFNPDLFPLVTGCLANRYLDLDGLVPTTGTATHVYQGSSPVRYGVVMRADLVLKWTTIVSTFPWCSIAMQLPPKPGLEVPRHPQDNGSILLDKIVEATVTPPAATACNCTPAWASDATGPGARMQHATVWDPLRQELVLFGGWDGTQGLGDTWVYDGNAWTQHFPPTSPPRRRLASMAFDSVRGVVVMQGGYDDTVPGYVGETWTWDGSNWTLVSTGGPSTGSAGMAFDTTRGVVVYYGGVTSSGRSRSTFEWDGSSWTTISSNSPPGFRSGHKMVYVGGGRMHMFGGQQPSSVETNDNWQYMAGTWTNLGASGPSPRHYHAMTYDPTCDRIYLYGGFKDDVYYGDLWLYASGSWQQVASNNPPGLRYQSSMDWLPGISRLLLYGGANPTVLAAPYLYGCDPGDVVVDLPPEDAVAATRLRLEPGVPNPFRQTTRISYWLPHSMSAGVELYDVAGRRVRVLRSRDAMQVAGRHTLTWDGRDEGGRAVAAGVYFCRLHAASEAITNRILLLR